MILSVQVSCIVRCRVSGRARRPVIVAGNRIDDVMLNHPVERDGRGMGITDRQLTGIGRACI